GVCVLVMARSARAITGAVAVEEFGLGPGSVVVLETEAVLSSDDPSGVLAFTVALIRIVLEPPPPIAPRESEPVHGALGVQPVVSQYVSPVSCDGSVSETDTFCASDGPLFVTTMV